MSKYECIDNLKLKKKVEEIDNLSLINFYFFKNNTIIYSTSFRHIPNFKINIILNSVPKIACKIKYFEKEIEILNQYITINKPTLRRLVQHINKTLTKYDIDQDIARSFFYRYYKTNEITKNEVINNALNKIDINSRDILIEEYFRIKNIKSKFVIKPKNDNIFIWDIHFTDFENENLSKDLQQIKNNEIKIKLLFTNYYPFYPPQIKVIRPHLKNNLVKNITDIKLLRFEYWSPSADIYSILTKVYNILNTKAIVDISNKKYSKIDQSIMRFENLYEVSESLDVGPCIMFNKDKNKTVEKVSNKYGKNTAINSMNGTGYGNGYNETTWDPNKYVELQNKKDQEINDIIKEIINDLPESNIQDIKQTNLMKHLYKMLNTTLLDISKREETYTLVFNLLINIICVDEGLSLFDDSIISIIKSLGEEIANIKLLCDDDSSLYNTILSLDSLLVNSINTNENIVDQNGKNIQDIYVSKMEPLKFDICNLSNVKSFKTLHNINIDEYCSLSNMASKRATRELVALKKTLPIFYNSSIFIRVHEKNSRFIRALITGPDDTPYDSGIFIFDLYITNEFPQGPPSLMIMNGGGKRLNPNLYECGKVCLSLLGTWQGESWDSQTSSLIQLLISVQAQILVQHPYFNEPGYQREYGTESGTNHSNKYNSKIKYYVMMNNIYDTLVNRHKYPEFEQVILEHFTLKKDYIIALVDKWVETSLPSCKEDYIKISTKIKEMLKTL